MKRVVLHILLGLILVGCSKSNSTTPTVEQTAVSFESNIDWPDSDSSTRGEAKTDFDEGDEIGIFAYYSQDGESIENLTPNFMYNQLTTLEQSGNSFAWLYSPVKYWPNNTTDSLQFFAYHPHYTYSSDDDDIKIKMSSSSYTGYPTINFTQAEDLGKQVDFMTAQTDPLAKCDVVPLSFEHQLTKVSFAACHNGVITDEIYVTEVVFTINDVQVALTGGFTDEGFVATTEGDEKTLDYTLTTENGYLNSGYAYRIETDGYKTVNSSTGTLMLPAQIIVAGSVTIEVTVSINRGWNDADTEGIEDAVTGVKTLYLIVNDEHEYLAGYAITYQFTLDLETSEVGMDIDNIVREVWIETGEDIGADNLEGEGGSIW